MRPVAVVGVGMTGVGHHNTGLRELFADAATRALEDCDINKVDAIYVGNMLSGRLQHQESLGTLCANTLGMTGISTVKVEGACASGGVAVHAGFNAVRSGASDLVLVAGVEKMSGYPTPEVTSALMMAEDQENVARTGITFVGLNALIARHYMERSKVKHEDIAKFSVVCHEHALKNPYAQFHKKISVQDVLESPLIADPLRLLDCSAIGDGAAAVVLTNLENARQFTDSPVEIAASTVANDTLSLHQRADLTTFSASRISSARALSMAGIGPSDIDVLEVHDAFSILGVIALEDLGFAESGRGVDLIREGQIEVGGELPTNTFGGLKARGHPVGASGVYQVAELALQLRGEAGGNQVPDAVFGYAQSVGGIGSTVTGHILHRLN